MPRVIMLADLVVVLFILGIAVLIGMRIYDKYGKRGK